VPNFVTRTRLQSGNAANVIGWFVGILAFITSLPDFVDLQKWVSHYLAAAVAVFHR
jgi:hypothetical protein